MANWVTVWFLIACAIAFPVWLAFAWFYEFTPQGIKRESDVAEDASSRHSTARKLDFAIIAVLAVAVALLGWRLLVVSHAKAPAVAQAAKTAAFNPPADSIVVLPFQNLSNDKNQRYFSDGITEELTNALGQNTALRVIAWDTASHYRDSTQPATAIGKTLDVANVLTGKILREGNEIRVIVELVNARTGYQLWSDHYDDSLSNIFLVQDKISAAIADALKVKFAATNTQRTVNPQAHDLVLRVRALAHKTITPAALEQMRKLLERAIALDPDYADAHAYMAGVWLGLTEFSNLPLKEALPKMREEANKALALDPRNVGALIELANADAAEGKAAEAKAGYEHALALDPDNAIAHMDYGGVLPLQQRQAQYLEAVQLDPDNVTEQAHLAAAELHLGEYQQALAPLQALVRLDPTSADSALGLAQVYSLLHRPEDAVKAFDLAQPDTPLAIALVAAGRLIYQSVLAPKLHAQARTAVDALHGRADLDQTSVSDVLQLYIVLGQNDTALDLLTKICTPHGCGDLSDNPTFLPLRGDPRFEALVKKYDTVSKPAPAASSP